MNRNDCMRLLAAFEMAVIERESIEPDVINTRVDCMVDGLREVIVGLMASGGSLTVSGGGISTNPGINVRPLGGTYVNTGAPSSAGSVTAQM